MVKSKKINLSDKLLLEIRNIAKKYPIRKIFLFGSRARGDFDPRSDIDLAASAPTANQSQWLKFSEEIQDLTTLLEIDLIKFEEASVELKQKIVDEGIVIYDSKNQS